MNESARKKFGLTEKLPDSDSFFRLATELNTPEQSARTINFLLSLKGTLHVIFDF